MYSVKKPEVGINELTESEGPDYLLSLKIKTINANDQAFYIEYLGTHGWEKVLAGNGNS